MTSLDAWATVIGVMIPFLFVGAVTIGIITVIFWYIKKYSK